MSAPDPSPSPDAAGADAPLIAAVTGTNGKTSVATAMRQLMQGIGWSVAAYDSLGVTEVDGTRRPARTRKSAQYLPELIAEQSAAGAEALCLEAFVGILADGLFAHVPVDVAVCTGLERDHLDVHGSVESYWAAKLSLFERHLRPEGTAVVAAGCAQGDLVRAAAARRGARLLEVGPQGDLRLEHVREESGRLEGVVRWSPGADAPAGAREQPGSGPGRPPEVSAEVSLPTVHDVAVTNLLLAAAAVIAGGGEVRAVLSALERVEPAPGRLQVVVEREGVRAMVDTAHNPGALRAALSAVRSRTPGRIVLVVGAGGERDRAKRPEMGAIAAELADLVVLTDDNPRREPPERIRADVRRGCPDCVEVPDRGDAIRAALEMAREGDTVLVAGKGDEDVQLRASGRIPHDDRAVIRRWWERRGS